MPTTFKNKYNEKDNTQDQLKIKKDMKRYHY
jgi:hypothetical protein